MDPQIKEPEVKIEGKPPEGKEPEKKDEKNHEPPVDSKRWKELYWENKENKRQLDKISKERTEDKAVMEEMKTFNKSMKDSMHRIEDNQFQAVKEPDAIDDPEAFKQFHFNKGKHEAEKELREKEPKVVPITKTNTPEKTEFEKAEEWARHAFPDYDVAITEVNKDLEKNPMLSDQIYNSKEFPNNAPRAAYEYYKKKKEQMKENTDGNLDASYAEGSARKTTSGKKMVLNERQKTAAKRFGMTEKEYIEQLDFCEQDYENQQKGGM